MPDLDSQPRISQPYKEVALLILPDQQRRLVDFLNLRDFLCILQLVLLFLCQETVILFFLLLLSLVFSFALGFFFKRSLGNFEGALLEKIEDLEV
jgi:hypothetical protein